MGLFEEGGHMSPAAILEFRQSTSSQNERADTERFRDVIAFNLLLRIENLRATPVDARERHASKPRGGCSAGPWFSLLQPAGSNNDYSYRNSQT
jgi:hypothetical protein